VKPTAILEEFASVAEANGGIGHLRRMVLDLAVRGKLVPQKADDGSEPAEHVEAPRGKSAAKDRDGVSARKYEDVPVPPVDLPRSWRWARLGDVVRDHGQTTPSRPFTYIDVSSIDNARGRLCDDLDVLQAHEAPTRARKLVAVGSVIYSTVRPYLLNIAVIENLPKPEPIVSTAFAVLHPVHALDSRFLHYVLRSGLFVEYVERQMTGIAYPAINDAKLYSGWICVPPLAEQKRIVMKVDQIMALCDDLEAKQTKKRAFATQSTRAALTALAMADTVTDLKETWARVASNFNGLAADPDAVNAFREAALSLGLGGWLGDIAPRGRTNGEELRAGWWRGSLGDAAEFVTSGSRNWKNFHSESGSIFIRSQDIRSDALDLTSPAFVSLPGKAEGTRTRVKLNDVLLTISGANVGKAAYVTHDVGEAYVSQHVALIRLRDPSLAPWVHRWLVCQSKGRGQLLGASYGDKPGLNLDNVRSVPLEVPPTGEREMLLARMGVLLAVCDDLEAKLRSQEETATRLAESLAAAVAA